MTELIHRTYHIVMPTNYWEVEDPYSPRVEDDEPTDAQPIQFNLPLRPEAGVIIDANDIPF